MNKLLSIFLNGLFLIGLTHAVVAENTTVISIIAGISNLICLFLIGGLYIVTNSTHKDKYLSSLKDHNYSMSRVGDICYDLFVTFLFVYASFYLTAYIYCIAMMYCHYIYYYARKTYGDN